MAVNMDQKIRARTAARGWVTRTCTKLEDLCKQEVIDVQAVSEALNDLNERLNNLDNTQSVVELVIDEEDLDADIEAACVFREKALQCRLLALKTLSSFEDRDEVRSHSSESSTVVEAKLPKLELPTFGGDIKNWTPFWEQFETVVDRGDLPDVTKFAYLRSLLEGEAKASIQGLSLKAVNYKIACELLKQRYGRPERIIFAHVQELLVLEVPSTPSVEELWKTYNSLQSHIRSLAGLDIAGEQYGVILTPLVLSRLPQDLRLEWAREGEGHERDLDFLMDFLRKEIERRERSQTFTTNTSIELPATAAALQTSTQSHRTCELCNRKNHAIASCYTLTRAKMCDRKAKLRNVGACFKCLSTVKGHSFRKCKAKCTKCKGGHHALLCSPKDPETDSGSGNSTDACTPSTSTHQGAAKSSSVPLSRPCEQVHVSGVNTVSAAENRTSVLMQTVQVLAKGQGRVSKAVILFDTGSDRSYISKDLVDRVGPEWLGSEALAYAAFGTETASSVEERNVYSVQLQGNGSEMRLKATEISAVCVPLCQPSVPKSVLTSFGGDVEFVSVPAGEKVKVDILVGLDAYWKFMTNETKFLSQSLVAQKSVFGWVLSGCVPVANSVLSSVRITHQLFCTGVSEAGLKSFWDLESVGICEKQSSVVDPVLEEFNKNVQFVDGRYSVSLPWKAEEERPRLLDNEKLTRARLDHLSKKLSKDPKLESKYHDIFCDMVKDHVIEEVPADEKSNSNPVFYLPHRPVLKESSLTTKIRPVFDASAKGFNGVSLNDCLETGPNLFPDLPGILLRFRRWKVALSADVTKAFLQIQVNPADRDVHRFLWNDNGEVKKMRFTRVPFGDKSSPFLLNATIKHHLAQFPPSHVTEELSENLYMDDWLSGCDDHSEACDMLREANKVMNQAGMSLAKWGSNSEEVDDLLCREFQDKSVGSESFKVLGMRWLASQDCFSFDGLAVPGDLCVTKRVVLSLVSRLFDPLGFLTPFVVTAKCLFQELWRLGIAWDQVVPETLHNRFTAWIKGLEELKSLKIPRSYTGVPWMDTPECQLHAFGDASPSAYGACVYLRVKMSDGSWKSSLVIARAKVAPLKRLSLPRLELLGALLCARLVVYARQALKLKEDVVCHCWTDSAVTLAWIQSDPYRWKQFVANRVAEIQALVSPAQWRHCPGKENPADLVTRGVSAGELLKSQVWFRGPDFLSQRADDDSVKADSGLDADLSVESQQKFSDVVCSEQSKKACMNQHMLISVAQEEVASEVLSEREGPHSSEILDIGRWSSLIRAMRVLGWVRRFVFNVKAAREQRVHGDLSFSELCEAKLSLLKYVQTHAFPKELQALQSDQAVPRRSSIQKLSPFIGKDGLLRVQGRLQFSGLPYDVQHPVILPKGHLGLLLARQVHSSMKHAGVNNMLVELRNQYWILGARRICKRVKRECVSCQRQDAPSGSQTMAPLPELRVKQAPPFSVTGLDHAGPLYCGDFPGRKFYVLLFTCAVTRAVHLELVDSVSCEATVMALRRFFARRGVSSVIMSDNAKGFQAARTQLLDGLGPDAPQWKFIAPRAPWWGGWWERLVASVKSALKRCLGKKSLSRQQLETLLHEVEACINARPLTFVGDELDSGTPLTPAHFLLGRSPFSKVTVEPGDVSVNHPDLVERQELRHQLFDQFWFCWVNEYVRNLPPCKGGPVKSSVQPGSVVLVRDEGKSRLGWPLGVVQAVHPGKDGLVRAVEVKTAKGVVTRPVQKVHDLELTEKMGPSSPVLITEPSSQETSEDLELGMAESVACSSDGDDSSAGTSDSVQDLQYVSRCGRSVKKPVKLDL